MLGETGPFELNLGGGIDLEGPIFMWIFYQFKFIRRDIGGKWGQVTGFFFGKRWVKLPETALLYDEFYDYSFGPKKWV